MRRCGEKPRPCDSRKATTTRPFATETLTSTNTDEANMKEQ